MKVGFIGNPYPRPAIAMASFYGNRLLFCSVIYHESLIVLAAHEADAMVRGCQIGVYPSIREQVEEERQVPMRCL